MQGNPQSSWLRTHMHARSKDEMRQKVAEFESKFGMPQAFGCIDGTHIPLKRPGENSHQERTDPRIFQSFTPGSAAVPNYLTGDPAYPLVSFYMREYEICSTNEQVVFNNLLRSARNPILCVFTTDSSVVYAKKEH